MPLRGDDLLVSKDNLKRCTFGAVFWIDDDETGLKKERHPWVIIEDYDVARPYVRACLRTTSGCGSVKIPAFFDGQRVDKFNKDGRIDPGYCLPIDIETIRVSDYGGHLPAALCDVLRNALRGGSR